MAEPAPRVIPYGEWPSSISAADVARAGTRLGQAAWHDQRLWWVEGRPEEAGRSVVVSAAADGSDVRDEIPATRDARSSVHEYGGGAFCVGAPGLAFVDASDQAVYLICPAGTARRLTRADENASYADLQFDPGRYRLLAVREDYSADPEPRASLVAIALDGQAAVEELVAGEDFYASPRLSPDGSRLAWLTWRHPDMPWDASQLWHARMDAAGGLQGIRQIAGGAGESLFHPVFAPNGQLHVVSDRSGWWNIYRVDADAGLQAVTAERAEFGQPQWVFGQSSYAFDDDGSLFALLARDGMWQLAAVDAGTGGLRLFDLPFTHLEQLRVRQGRLAFIGGSASEAPTLCVMQRDGRGLTRLRPTSETCWDESILSTPESLAYPTADGEAAHALFYPPCNPLAQGPDNEPPPLLIKCHGGPTGATSTPLDPRIQFWTSRGFAVLDVNYRGSTGYGTAYRRKLYGRWGIADVEDCEHGVRYLAERGWIDPARVVISGASAGGYTVLCVLAWSDIAAAGASYYGIGDLRRLLESTHKFESRYLGRLVSENPNDYEARSPLFHADRITCPVLFLQGGRDRVVPPDQAETMAAALRNQGLPVAHILFPEERHGFRSADNMIRAQQAELAFYGRILGFTPRDEPVELHIDNLD